MSSGTSSKFVKQFTEKNIQKGDVKKFNLNEIIDPSDIGKQKFTYESEQGQNFDETNVKKAREGAKEILATAIEKAKRKSIQIREEARKLGYDEGHKEGFKKGEVYANEEFSPLFKVFEGHIQELSEFRRKIYGKVEREMIEMVVALTKKILHREFSSLENVVQQMIRLAVASVLDKENLIIKINPNDKTYAEKFQPELLTLFDEIKNISFETTPSLSRGECEIETNFGTIDANLEYLNDQIEKTLNALIYRSHALTPETFESNETHFPKTEEVKTPLERGVPNEEVPNEEKSELENGGDVEEDSNNIDGFDFPDVSDKGQ